MNYTTSTEQMFRTTDYKGFKRVVGNRAVMEERVTKILASMDKIGYIPIPLVVNEKYEVIDGQGRLEACRRRGLPVNFIIKPGLKIDDCITMNINVSPWNLMDFILCYAEIGNQNYEYIKKLMDEMKEEYGAKYISTDVLCASLYNVKRSPANAIKSGRLTVSGEQYENAKNSLQFTLDIIDFIDRNKVRLKSKNITSLVRAIIFCFKYDGIDNTKLEKVLKESAHLMQKWTNVESCLEEIDYIYNYNAKKRTVPLKRLWEDLGKDKPTNFIPVDPTTSVYNVFEDKECWEED